MRPPGPGPCIHLPIQPAGSLFVIIRQLKERALIPLFLVLMAPPVLLVPQAAEAQDGGRFRVMIPNLTPTDDTRDRFGSRVANNLRNSIDLDTHVGLSERDMDRAARDYGMRANQLGCLEARQLAALIEIPLVMCGVYNREGDQLRLQATVYTVPGAEEYPVGSFLIAENDERGATERIMSNFSSMVEQVRFVGFCGEAYATNDWDRALQFCTQALQLAPESQSARIALGGTHMELENFEEALSMFQQVLRVDEWNGDVLLNAGYAASQLAKVEDARGYYTRYLDINPGSTAIRLRVAFDLAQAGDVEGAMDFVKEGLESNPDDMGLLEAYGSYAFRVALERQSMTPTGQDTDMPSEIATLFREASEVLMRVVEEEGAESNPVYVINAVRAYLQLEQPQEALRTVERGLQIFPDAANLWVEKGAVHNRMQDPDAAVAAFERGMRADPNLPNIRARMGNTLVQAGRLSDGLPYLKQAIEAGEQTADQVGNTIFGDAYSNGIQNNRDLEYGIRTLVMAKEDIPVSAEFRQQLDFWHGYAIFQRAIRRQEPNTVQSAQATLPEFRQARELMQAGQGYVQRTGVVQLGPLLENVGTYIEIQEAIIRRGR